MVTVVLLAGCPPARPRRAPAEEWPTGLGAAHRAAGRGDYVAADSLLRGLERRFAGTAGAREIGYWRAVYALDPANPAAAPATAVAFLDAYLADTVPVAHRAEAAVLRRATVAMDSLRRTAATLQRTSDSLRTVADSSRAGVAARDARDRAREEELQRLREQLVRTAGELNRIKRRLAAPRP